MNVFVVGGGVAGGASGRIGEGDTKCHQLPVQCVRRLRARRRRRRRSLGRGALRLRVDERRRPVFHRAVPIVATVARIVLCGDDRPSIERAVQLPVEPSRGDGLGGGDGGGGEAAVEGSCAKARPRRSARVIFGHDRRRRRGGGQRRRRAAVGTAGRRRVAAAWRGGGAG